MLVWIFSLAVAMSGLGLTGSALAQSQLQLEFNNGSPGAVKLMQWNRNGSGQWEDHGFVPAGRVVYKTAPAGTQWAFVNPSDNALIESLTASRFSRQLKIDARHFGGGGGGGQGQGGHDDHDHDDHQHGGGGHGGAVQPILVELHANNHSSQSLYLYRDSGKGSLEYVTTLPAGRDYKGKTPINTAWAFVSPNGTKVVKRLTVNSEHNDLEIHNKDLAPPAPQAVSVTFRNLSGQTLEVYHGVPGQRGGHVIGKVGHGQQQVLQSTPGDNYAILRAADHSLVKKYQIPGRTSVFTVDHDMVHAHGHAGGGGGGNANGGGHGGHDDHDDHGGGGHDDHDDHDDHGGGKGKGQGQGSGLPDPRELLRRILGGGK